MADLSYSVSLIQDKSHFQWIQHNMIRMNWFIFNSFDRHLRLISKFMRKKWLTTSNKWQALFFKFWHFLYLNHFIENGAIKRCRTKSAPIFFANRAFLSSAFQGNGTFIHAKAGDTALICFPFSVINVRVIGWCHCWLIYWAHSMLIITEMQVINVILWRSLNKRSM